MLSFRGDARWLGLALTEPEDSHEQLVTLTENASLLTLRVAVSAEH